MIDVSKFSYKRIMIRRKLLSMLWRRILPFFSRTLANEANIGRKLKKLLTKTRDTRKQVSFINFPSIGIRKHKIRRDEDDDEDDDNDSLESKRYHSRTPGKPSLDSLFR